MNDYQFPSDTLFKTYQPDYVMHPFVSMHAVLASNEFKQENEMALPIALGGRTYSCCDREVFMFDLAETNVLIGGVCGYGKTTAINAMITSLLYKKRPEELKFVLIDPSGYNAALFKPLGERYLALMEVTDGARSIINDCDDAIKTLDAFAFSQRRNLSHITIPDSVVYIGEFAFSGCFSLDSEITLHGIRQVPRSCFSGCTRLKKVIIGDGVKAVEGAFDGCSLLSDVVITEGTKYIGNMAFYNCINLVSVTLPKSIERIESTAFERCNRIERIVIPQGTTDYFMRFDALKQYQHRFVEI